MTQPTTAPGTGWSVTGQRTTTAPNQAGVLATQWEVSFVTSSGQTGTVLIPTTNYNVDTVRAAIASAAMTMDQIQGLKG